MSHMVEQLELSNERGYLWPPIADAVDTYLRRRASEADGYELTWRLIHVWEAIATTLAAAAATRVRGEEALKASYQKCREHYHGRSWNAITQSFSRSQGALDGSATRRIDVLYEMSNAEVSSSPFLTSLKEFLTHSSIDLSELVIAWARICDVPADVRRDGKYTVREAMRHINTFRNRFAHVPFPYDIMGDVATALARVTEQLFTVPPDPSKAFVTSPQAESPLCGAFLWKGRAMRGGANFRCEIPWSDGCAFTYPAMPKTGVHPEVWNAAPFVFIDSMIRPYVMTRLRSEASGSWEFTRFRAEANSVVTVEEAKWLAELPEPAQSEYLTAQDTAERAEEKEIEAEAPPQLLSTEVDAGEPTSFAEALRFIRNEDYEPAIGYLARYVEVRPDYHTGWLRLGHAQRELAMRRRAVDRDQAAALFDDAVHSLSRAAEHRDPIRRAQAFYERSKARYQRGRFNRNDHDVNDALTDAKEAFSLSPDSAYQSWMDYIYRSTEQPVASASAS